MVSFNTSARQMTVSVTQMTQKKMTEMFQRKKQHWRSVTKSYEIKIKQPQSYSRQALSLPWSDEGQIEASAWTYKKTTKFSALLHTYCFHQTLTSSYLKNHSWNMTRCSMHSPPSNKGWGSDTPSVDPQDKHKSRTHTTLRTQTTVNPISMT